MSSLSEEFAALIVGTTLQSLPEPLVAVLEQDLVDVVGCALWGLETPWGQRILQHVASSGPGPASIWGTGLTSAPDKAALALGTLAHAIDFDDYHPGAKVHPAAVVLPAALALGEALGSSGADVLVAAALGFEVMIRVSLATGSVAGMLNGYHMTGITGGVGAAAAAAKLLGLDRVRTAHALGLAATQASGLMGFVHEGSDTKRLHAGRAAEIGIVSAQLAAIGMTAPPHMLEMPHGGFMSAFSTDPHPDRALLDLGRRWHAAEISFKRFSCCGSIHSSVEALGDVVAAHALDAGEVERISVRQSRAVIAQCGWPYQASNAMHAQMSMRYCLAVYLLDGQILPTQFRDDRLDAPDVVALAARIDVVEDEEMELLYPERFASVVEVEARGRVFEGRCMSPSGSADNPVAGPQIEAKFRALASGRIGADRAGEFLAAAREVVHQDHVRSITGALVPAAVLEDSVAT